MDAVDVLERIVSSPLFEAVMVMTVAALGAYAVRRTVRSQQRLVAFMQTHGLRFSDTGSTMWLARMIEQWAVRDISGHLDGLWIDVRSRPRQGRRITVTANQDLVTKDAGVVSLGAWTHPSPPALLKGMHLDVSGRQLRVFVGDGDFVPHLQAAVAYAKALESQPVDPDAGRVSG